VVYADIMTVTRTLTLLSLVLLWLSACSAPPQPPATVPAVVSDGTPSATIVRPSPTVVRQLTATPAAAATAAVPAVARDEFFDPQRLSYDHNFGLAEIDAWLTTVNPRLVERTFPIGYYRHRYAEVLISVSSLYSISPRLLLTLVVLQNGGGAEAALLNSSPAQLKAVAREVRSAIRDYSLREGDWAGAYLADGARVDLSAAAVSRFVITRAVAGRSTTASLAGEMSRVAAAYNELFGFDPREAPQDWPAPAAPFLSMPLERIFPITSFFDHNAPFLRKNGTLTTFWGRDETDSSFAYDGHTGWDFAMGPPEKVLAAAAGTVLFAGASDDGCGAPALAAIIDHGNGYRTLYWHLDSLNVRSGDPVARGAVLGVAGNTGCSTGAHLHLQTQYLGRDVDPFGWCGNAEDPWAAQPLGSSSRWLWQDMPSPCEPAPPEMIVVDDSDAGFSASDGWQQLAEGGYAGSAHFAQSVAGGNSRRPWRIGDLEEPLVAVWQPQLPAAGRYRVLVYVPFALNGLDDSQELRYLIRHNGGEATVLLNGADARNWWAELGVFELDPAREPLVAVTTVAGDRLRGVWADAVAFIPLDGSSSLPSTPGR
jgi:murein DD-endopeptidase MepM/ murein hydrolase activator NlpD